MRIKIFITAFLFQIGLGFSQVLKPLLKDTSLTYFELKNKIYENDKQLLNKLTEKEQKNWGRYEWYWSDRVDGNGNYVAYASNMLDYIQRRNQQPKMTAKTSTRSKLISNQISWSEIGPTSLPQPICSSSISPSGIGFVSCVWSNPNVTSAIYIGTIAGGLWKKATPTSSWVNLTDDLYSFGVHDIVVDPQNPQKIFIATGCNPSKGTSLSSGNYGFGVFYSKDGGNTWQTDKMTTTPSEDFYIEKLLMNPTNSNVIYALSSTKVYKTNDGGNTWNDTNAPNNPDKDYYNIVFKPSDTSVILISSSSSNKIYRTTNSANSWDINNLAYNLNTTKYKHKIGLASSVADPNSFFVAYVDKKYYYTPDLNDEDSTYTNVYLEKSVDNGDTWTSLVINKSLGRSIGGPGLELSISPNNANTIYIGNLQVAKYDNSLSTFEPVTSRSVTPMNKFVHDDIRDVLVTSHNGNEVVYACNDGGIAASYDGGTTWVHLEDGLHIGSLYSVSSTESNPNKLMIGAHDCSTHIYDGTNWKNTSCNYCDGGSVLIDESDDDNMILMCNGRIYKSTDEGISWSYVMGLIEYNSPIIQDPVNPNIFYFGEWHPKQYNSSTSVLTNLTTVGSGNKVTCMDISKTNPNVFYFSRWCGDGSCGLNATFLFRRSDDGSTWVDLTSNIGNPPAYTRITSIKINPHNTDIVWVTFGGLTTGEKVYETRDGGITWQNISYNLENFPVQSIEYDEVNHSVIIGTDIGVFHKDLTSNNWAELGDFPKAMVTQLEFNRKSGKLYASTFGRGLWMAEIPGMCYDGTTQTITTNTLWNTDMNLCTDLVVASGTLTITAKTVIPYSGCITIKNGAKLKVDGGLIENAHVLVESGGELILINNGKVEINNGDELNMHTGGLLDLTQGEVLITSE